MKSFGIVRRIFQLPLASRHMQFLVAVILLTMAVNTKAQNYSLSTPAVDDQFLIALTAPDNEFVNIVYDTIDLSSLPEELSVCLDNATLRRAPRKFIAGLCNIFFGSLGIGHFIVGQPWRGVLDIVFFWTGIPAAVGVVEGFAWLCMSRDNWISLYGF